MPYTICRQIGENYDERLVDCIVAVSRLSVLKQSMVPLMSPLPRFGNAVNLSSSSVVRASDAPWSTPWRSKPEA